jgi:hypothetical protein
LNRDSRSSANQRCAGCHSQGPAETTGGSRAVPADWRPDASDLAWLGEHRPDLDARYMTEVFVCGSRARGLRYADPSAAWRRWALAERPPGGRPVAAAMAPPETRDLPPRPLLRGYYAEQRERWAARCWPA